MGNAQQRRDRGASGEGGVDDGAAAAVAAATGGQSVEFQELHTLRRLSRKRSKWHFHDVMPNALCGVYDEDLKKKRPARLEDFWHSVTPEEVPAPEEPAVRRRFWGPPSVAPSALAGVYDADCKRPRTLRPEDLWHSMTKEDEDLVAAKKQQAYVEDLAFSDEIPEGEL